MKSTLIKIGLIVGGLAVVVGASVYFALSDKGAIDVNKEIRATNQEGFATQVNPDTRATMPNGGLNPAGNQPAPQPAPSPTPEPQASSTDKGGEAGDIREDALPAGTDTGAQ